MAYNAGNKILHRYMSRKKNSISRGLGKNFTQIKSPKSPPPPTHRPPLKSQMVDPLEMWLVKTNFIIAHMNQRMPFQFQCQQKESRWKLDWTTQ